MDGHTGIETQVIDKGTYGEFQLVLTCLKDTLGVKHFVIHATSSKLHLSGLQTLDFLNLIRFTHFGGDCPFHHNKCYYYEIATLHGDTYGSENLPEVRSVLNDFRVFASKIDTLFSFYEQEDKVLREIGLKRPSSSLFDEPKKIIIKETDIPLWVEDIKFKALRKLENQSAELNREINKLRELLPLVYGTGNTLENAVLKALRFLGLEANRCKTGYTVDILAQTQDGSKRFGFEVTGIDDAIKKNSKKLTQVLDFERIKEKNEKTVLLANTFRLLSIKERNNRKNFTPNVIDFLTRYPILLITGWDFYRMVCDVLEKKKTPEEIIDLIFKTDGRLKY